MAKQFLNLTGLITFFEQLKIFFASATSIAEVEEDIETYVLKTDYDKVNVIYDALIANGTITE